jgi:hypothetical protein
MSRGGWRPNSGGRNRLPLAVKTFQGTAKASREREYAARSAGQPTELRFLVDSKGPDSLSEAEQRAWRELSLAVNVGGGITPADLPGFRALVRTQAAWDAMADNFDPSGEGKITASAFASMTGRLMSQLDHFRLAPSSRGAVTIAVPERPPEPDESDPDDLRPLDELPPGRPLKQ